MAIESPSRPKANQQPAKTIDGGYGARLLFDPRLAWPARPEATAPQVTPPALDAPHLRGWLHAGAVPLAALAGAVLVGAARTAPVRAALLVFALSACGLFATLAAFHRGRWSAATHGWLMRADYANIHLWIATSTTALVVALAEDPMPRLLPVWAAALFGAAATVVRPILSRWWRMAAYLVVGVLATAALAAFLPLAGGPVTTLVVASGASYGVGGLVYGFRFPDPSPRWFGYHEVFHALTILGFGAHGLAVWLAITPGA